jgi:hypothetical protein
VYRHEHDHHHDTHGDVVAEPHRHEHG